MLSKYRKINTQLFKKILKEGKTYHFTYFSVKILKLSIKNKNRFTIVVSKKIIKRAVSRNFIRRRFFNIIKNLFKESPTTNSFAIIFFLKKGIKKMTFNDFKEEIIKVFNKIQLIN